MISCWGEPIARKQNRNGLTLSIWRRQALHGFGVADEIHGRIDVMERLEPVRGAQELRLRDASTDQDGDISGLDDRAQNARRQVASRAHAERLALHEPDGLGYETAVQEHIGGLLVERPELGVLEVANQMVGIGRDQVAVAVAPELGDQAHGIFRIVIVDIQNVMHGSLSRCFGESPNPSEGCPVRMRATSRFGDTVFTANRGIYAAKFFESRPGRGRYVCKIYR